MSPKRIAFIVSHPIQYFVPLYQRLARRTDLTIKVFFTWHAGDAPVEDRGFGRTITWDIPLTSGYDFELTRNVAADPGTHHFFGLRNPTLVESVRAWRPDAVHITGWAWLSHLQALRALRDPNTLTLFRGDSHLLDRSAGLRWFLKRILLTHVYSWPSAFLVVGKANRAYYEAFGVQGGRLFPCPHSIDVQRFASPNESLEREAKSWRRELGIADECVVILFAGKFERKKRPIELMRAVQTLGNRNVVLLLVGDGKLDQDVKSLAATDVERFRVLPFQNQTRMPVVYRTGDLFVLPSAYGETWGLAVNEAMACGRPVLVSDRVGCSADVVDPSCGRIFSANDFSTLVKALEEMSLDSIKLADMGRAASKRAWSFDVSCTESALVSCFDRMCAP